MICPTCNQPWPEPCAGCGKPRSTWSESRQILRVRYCTEPCRIAATMRRYRKRQKETK